MSTQILIWNIAKLVGGIVIGAIVAWYFFIYDD